MKIKICGLSRTQDIEIINKYKPDYAGFVFAKSKRQVTPEAARALKAMLSPQIKAVGVFVDEDLQNVISLLKQNIIDMAQLHGSEEQNYINALKKECPAPVIKAVRADGAFVLPEINSDYILFDSGPGGTGKTFDWQKIKDYKKPFFLAGGLDAENIKSAAVYKPYCADFNSGVETDGVKDEQKIKQIINIVRSIYD